MASVITLSFHITMTSQECHDIFWFLARIDTFWHTEALSNLDIVGILWTLENWRINSYESSSRFQFFIYAESKNNTIPFLFFTSSLSGQYFSRNSVIIGVLHFKKIATHWVRLSWSGCGKAFSSEIEWHLSTHSLLLELLLWAGQELRENTLQMRHCKERTMRIHIIQRWSITTDQNLFHF